MVCPNYDSTYLALQAEEYDIQFNLELDNTNNHNGGYNQVEDDLEEDMLFDARLRRLEDRLLAVEATVREIGSFSPPSMIRREDSMDSISPPDSAGKDDGVDDFARAIKGIKAEQSDLYQDLVQLRKSNTFSSTMTATTTTTKDKGAKGSV